MLNALESMVSLGELSVVESLEVGPEPEKRLNVPQVFLDGPAGQWLSDGHAADGTLWRHQSLALDAVSRGVNVIMATGTASGKSLVFQVTAFHELLSSGGKTLVLY